MGSFRDRTYSLAKADHRPQTEAQRTTAAQAPAQKPANVHWQSFLQTAIYSVNTGFELLGCNLNIIREQNVLKLTASW